MKDGWRGIFSIAATPFDASGTLLFDELGGEIDWLIRGGAHGIVWPVGHSEFTALSREERRRGTQVVIEAASGRAPVIIGCSAVTDTEAALYATHAADEGADGVIAMLPLGFRQSQYELVRRYFDTVARASELPVFIQNQGPPWPSLAAQTVVQLCVDIPGVEYVKEEKPPQTASCQEILDLCGDSMRGVFSGGGCSWLISEMKRGISGCMPGAPVSDICAKVWDLWWDGQHEEACTIHALQTAYMNVWRGMPAGARKWVLVLRGVISTAHARNQGTTTLDRIDRDEVERAIALLDPYMVV